ncbi:hypothetical protein I3843_05G217600 [Carya illinoinensis]|uniref:PB1 domain-containing protein n=1 Tax=Carya illinoinensis TaxID=32201 RepID=A0A8T1QNX8_CARIL|nr:uncharacterized protein LOC122308898 [Carya illinoinensis]KAG2709428.1 hypothetical protein I3760_05G239000 [Carya illinoinensis]KAG6655814.1 hypothetical protein CIPAW_05G243000 [Carya illinoinensis]KAG6715124.1 hypothetical protein I3842_05G235400 [Carya illinoinensis]KAG7981142.1 hypothetical protein I3843_05G217600 [Carya illinoinensis]
MEPPPPAVSLSNAATNTISPHLAYPDSLDSSPRSRNTDSWDDTLPTNNAPTSAKLRLMCSYGGHIVPRPHDKSLCYVGGDTRIVVVDRHTSLSDLSSRLSKTLLNNRPFTLKYQLPNEDLDSLISVTTDEDLDNMIDEYDRISSNSIKPSRLRLFLFPLKPDSSQSIGPILENSAKSEDWFLNALNAAGLLNRGFSDPASVNCLLGLDDDSVGGNNLDSGGARDLEAAQPGSFGNGKSAKQGQDVHSVPDSPMLETTSSFGSTSSSPSLANLPPIRVHVEDGGGSVGGGGRVMDQKVGIEEQFAQISVSSGPKQDEGFSVISSPPPMPVNMAVAPAMSVSSGMVVGEYPNRVISDDERSDHGVPVGYRRVPAAHPQSQPHTLPPQSQPKSSGGLDLPSPDSVSSDSSITNPLSRLKPVYQDSVVQIPSGNLRVPANPVDPKFNISDPNTRVQMQPQVPDSAYVLQSQFDQQQMLLQQTQHQQHQQQQFMQGTHYVHHTPTGVMPIPAYYPVYPSQQQHHHPQHNPLDQQYSVYYVPSRQAQAYNLSVQQSNISEAATGVPSSRPQTPPTAAMAPPSVYNPTRNATMAKPEMAAGAYRTATTGAPQLVQVPSNQHQQQYLGYSQIHHPSQSMAPTSAAAGNYAYDFAADPAHGQIYYTQPLAPTMHSQYQTMSPATAGVLPETSGQLPTDNSKQQIRTSQPL